MGHYRNGDYYRGKNDGELQWVEDAINLAFGMVFYGVCAFAVGLFTLACGLLNFTTSDKGNS
jgi:hypothetical protein